MPQNTIGVCVIILFPVAVVVLGVGGYPPNAEVSPPIAPPPQNKDASYTKRLN